MKNHSGSKQNQIGSLAKQVCTKIHYGTIVTSKYGTYGTFITKFSLKCRAQSIEEFLLHIWFFAKDQYKEQFKLTPF